MNHEHTCGRCGEYTGGYPHECRTDRQPRRECTASEEKRRQISEAILSGRIFNRGTQEQGERA